MVDACLCCTAPNSNQDRRWARGLCGTCRNRHAALGTLHLYPTKLRRSADTAEDYAILRRRDPSMSRAEIAARLGMTLVAMDRALVRHRARQRTAANH